MPLFTSEQYNQIVQLLSKGKEVDTMANVATFGTTGIATTLMSDIINSNWIVDTSASNHMVHSLTLIDQYKELGAKGDIKVNLPTSGQVPISHVGESLILKDKIVNDVLFIHDLSIIFSLYHNWQSKCSVLCCFFLTSASFVIPSMGGSGDW